MTQNQPLREARLQQRVEELEDEVARLKARLLQYEGNETPHVAHKPTTVSHNNFSTNINHTTLPPSPVTTIPPEHLQRARLPQRSCTAPSLRSGTAPPFEVLVLDLKDGNTASVKSTGKKGDKAIDEIRANLDIWCNQSASDISASHSNEITVRDPDTTLGSSIHDRGKAWAQSVATTVNKLTQKEMLVRAEIFYFLIFTLVASRLQVITEEGALELLSIVAATDSTSVWLRRLLTSIAWINDDIIVELCQEGWLAAVATTAMSRSKIVHQSIEQGAYSN